MEMLVTTTIWKTYNNFMCNGPRKKKKEREKKRQLHATRQKGSAANIGHTHEDFYKNGITEPQRHSQRKNT
jgi:hypothetical protein